jgi:peptidoglycan/LPS O-acetylase OafA/YrhL
MLSYTFFGRWFEFFIGISLARLYSKMHSQSRIPINSYWTTTGILWMTGSISLLVLVKGNELFGVFTYYGIFINNVLLPIGIVMLFWGLIHENTLARRILRSRLFVILGKSSYTFYLIHLGVIANFVFLFTSNTLVGFVLLNIISIIFFKLIEEPCNKAIRKIKVTPS